MQNEINNLLDQLLDHYQHLGNRLGSVEGQPDYASKAKIMVETRSTLTAIKAIESQLFPMRDQFIAGGGTLSDSTNAKIDLAKHKVAELIPIVSMLEKTAVEDREKLAPEIHQGVQALKMQSAYTANQ